MKVKYKTLQKISWYIGLVAFVGGWFIFLLWTGGRYFAAWDLKTLEVTGFLWLAAFFWLSLLGLVILITYVLVNRKNLHLKMLFTAIMILINIPTAFLILHLQAKINRKVFVSLTNQTGFEKIKVKLHGNFKTWDFGGINNGSSKVFNYNPPYFNADARLYQKPDSLSLIILHNEIPDTIGFPALRMGECKQLILNENLEITPSE